MFSLLMLLGLNQSVICDDFDLTSAFDSQTIVSAWQKPVCNHFDDKGYKNISFSVINWTQNRRFDDIDKNSLGQISVGDFSAGRSKVVWSSKESDLRVSYWIKISAKKETWVFTRNLNPEVKIRKRYVKKKLLNVANISNEEGGLFSVQDRPVGMVTRRRVGKNQIVTKKMLSHPPLVKKNNEVTLLLKTGSLTITSQAIALSTGWEVGEEILVRINDTDETITVVISGERTANVEI